jgi:hypothetical protein
MNEANPYGTAADLPVDIRSRRWPIRYELRPLTYTKEPTADNKKSVQSQLARDLSAAIKAVIAREYEAVDEAFRKLDANCLSVLKFYAQWDGFFAPETTSHSLGSSTGVDSVVLNAAIPRLLDLGLIECGIKDGKYAYFWTYLGERLLLKQGWRQEASAEPP